MYRNDDHRCAWCRCYLGNHDHRVYEYSTDMEIRLCDECYDSDEVYYNATYNRDECDR